MDFEYRIENNEVIITGHIYNLVTEINIPDYIEGYRITDIEITSQNNCQSLTKINNIDNNNFGINIINDRFIFHRLILPDSRSFFPIIYAIGDNYVVKSNGKFYYFINNELYHTSFIKIF